MMAALERRYEELPVSLGLTAGGSLLEVLASPGGGTWTILVTVPGGPTCLVSAGDNWRTIAPQDPGQGS